MKRTIQITIALILFSTFAFAQKSEVIQDSVDNKAVIFSKSLIWVATTWKNANEVIQLKDEANGIIIIKGGLTSVPTQMGIPSTGMTKTQLTIRIKDGRAKLEFENTNFTSEIKIVSANGLVWTDETVWTTETKVSSGKKSFDRWKDDVLKEIDNLILNYKEFLNKKTDDF